METDITTFTRRNENLIERLSELPKEISADGIYKQIQTNADKLKELNQTLENLKGDEKKLATQAVNRDGLLFRIKRTIQNLERSPVGKRRGLYSNLIKFAELHPTKIRLGVYAPVETTRMPRKAFLHGANEESAARRVEAGTAEMKKAAG